MMSDESSLSCQAGHGQGMVSSWTSGWVGAPASK